MVDYMMSVRHLERLRRLAATTLAVATVIDEDLPTEEESVEGSASC